MNQDLTLEAVLAFETKSDLAVVVTTNGSVKLVMRARPTITPKYEVLFKKGDIRAITGYEFDADELDRAIDMFNRYAAKL